MRRHAVTDVALGLVFVGLGLLAVGMAVLTYGETYRCGGLPCDLADVMESRHPIYSMGFAVLFLGLGARLIWNVWRGQG
jgi:hypothetical protein